MRQPKDVICPNGKTLEEVLRLHRVWLNGEEEMADLSGADLSKANLSRADLSGVNLRGADLDHSAWPLWCGSLGVKADEALVGQLLYHVLNLAESSGIELKSITKVKKLANNSKVVTLYGKEKIK
jgi:hypothetical protein